MLHAEGKAASANGAAGTGASAGRARAAGTDFTSLLEQAVEAELRAPRERREVDERKAAAAREAGVERRSHSAPRAPRAAAPAAAAEGDDDALGGGEVARRMARVYDLANSGVGLSIELPGSDWAKDVHMGWTFVTLDYSLSQYIK